MAFKILLVITIALGVASYFFHQEGNFQNLSTKHRFKIFKD